MRCAAKGTHGSQLAIHTIVRLAGTGVKFDEQLKRFPDLASELSDTREILYPYTIKWLLLIQQTASQWSLS